MGYLTWRRGSLVVLVRLRCMSDVLYRFEINSRQTTLNDRFILPEKYAFNP